MENPTGWLVRSLKNESLQHFRKAQRIERLGNLEPEAIETGEEGRSEEVKQVFAFLESLPEKQREIFQLREVEGLTYEEIAEYLEISMEQVKVNLHRARKTLRNYLTQHAHER
jgi:RNA polymerase sigma-70 factor (ECF subfamily)